jgi:pSer/pThr/pTyr-binding forkhead associated (FHA) protein
MARLTFALDDGQEVVVPLTDHLTIGHAEGNDVVVNDEGLSAQHAELRQGADGGFEVRDLGSTSGTFVNDQRVQRRSLRNGDRLAFGPLTAVLDLEEPAVQEAEAAHREWLDSIQVLAAQHKEKTTALQKLTAEVSAAQQQIAALTAQQVKETSSLEQLRRERTQAEARHTALSAAITAETLLLEETRKRRADLETQCQQLATTEQTITQDREQLTTLQKQQAGLQKAATQSASTPASVPVPVPIQRTGRIVAIESPRFTVIPMKSERILRKNPDTPHAP